MYWYFVKSVTNTPTHQPTNILFDFLGPTVLRTGGPKITSENADTDIVEPINSSSKIVVTAVATKMDDTLREVMGLAKVVTNATAMDHSDTTSHVSYLPALLVEFLSLKQKHLNHWNIGERKLTHALEEEVMVDEYDLKYKVDLNKLKLKHRNSPNTHMVK